MMPNPQVTDSYSTFCDRLLDVPEIRRCVAEEIVMRAALPQTQSFDFTEAGFLLLDDWKSLRSDLLPEVELAFKQHYSAFTDTECEGSRLKLFFECVRKLDAHLSANEIFEASEYLGGDPYYRVELEGIAEPMRFGNCVSAEYSRDLNHIKRLREELASGNMIRSIQRMMCPFYDPSAFDLPDSWETSLRMVETVKYFREFEQENPIPSFLTSEENFTVQIPPRGCRLRNAVELLKEEGLPERIICLYGISLYETNAMVRFCSEQKSKIDDVELDTAELRNFLNRNSSKAFD